MSARQDTEVSFLVAEALAVELTPDMRLALQRRQDRGPLADRIQAIGAAIGISYLARTLDREQLRAAIDATTAPLVLLGETGDVVVIGIGRAEQSALAVRVTPVGARVPLPGRANDVTAEILTIVGDAPLALSPLSLVAPIDPLRATMEMMVDTRSAAAADSAGRVEIGVFTRVAQLLSRDRHDIVILFVYAALAGAFALTLPLSVGAIVSLVQGGLILQPVIVLIGYVIAATLAAGALQVLQLRVVERIQQRVFARLALEFTFRVPRIRYETAMQEELPETMNRLFEAVNIQKSLSKFLLDTSTALLTILAGLALLTIYSTVFTIFGVLLLLVLGAIIWFTGPKGLATSLMESKYKYRAVHWLEEQARAFHAFKFAGRSPLGVQRMDEILSGYLVYRNKHFKVLMWQTVAIVLVRTSIVAGFLILGAQLVIDRQILLGQFVAAEFVIVTVLGGVEKLILSMSTIYDILTAAEKAGHVSDLPLDESGGVSLPASRTGIAISLSGVTYRYGLGSAPVLSNATADVRPGERIGITGYEGAGRTTLLKLMGGLLSDFEGTLLFDGQPLRTLDRASLREQIGQYMSATDLFDGTVAENISVGRPSVDRAAIRRAMEDVGLVDDIARLPNGLDEQVTHGGKRLPHDTAIKLLFAQAIASSPRLLVIDDLFQNLQGDDRRRLVALLTDRARPWTVLVVSHDPYLLSLMDRVILLDDGVITREAPFAELLTDPYVKHLFEVDGRNAGGEARDGQ